MNDEELVEECLRKYDTNEAALNSIRCHGVDESVLQALREFGAGEELDNARIALRDFRHRKYAADEALKKARCRKAELDSISESPVWKDQEFLNKLSQTFMAEAFEKSRETTKHYIDSTKQPATGPKSLLGEPRRGADGQVLRDANGRVIWDTNTEQRVLDVQRGVKSVTADGKINPNVSRMGQPKLGLDGQVTWEVNDEPKTRRVNVRADGKIDPTKSLMGNPKLNADGSITWDVAE